MIPSTAARSEGLISAAASARGGTPARDAHASARSTNVRRNSIGTKTPKSNGHEEQDPNLIGGLDLFSFTLDFLRAVIRGGVLGQLCLGAAGLLCGVLLFSR